MKIIIALLLAFALLVNTSASAQESSALYLGGEYSWGESLSGFGVAMDLGHFFKDSRWGINLGISGGPGSGVYNNDLSNAEIMTVVYDQMSGTKYITHELPEKTDGGFYFSSRALLMSQFRNTKFKLAFGPRLNYFLKQEISVLTRSEDALYSYDEYVQVPYRKRTFKPGFEINLGFGDAVALKYARMFKQKDLTPMHSLGITFTLNFLSYASYY